MDGRFWPGQSWQYEDVLESPIETAHSVTSANQGDMDVPLLDASPNWSILAVVVLSAVTAIVAMFSLYASSRSIAAKNAEIGRIQGASAEAVAAAEARAALAEQRSSETAATMAAAAERMREIELDTARSWALVADTTHQRAAAGADLQHRAAAAARVHEASGTGTIGLTPPIDRPGSGDRRLTPEQRIAIASILKTATSPRRVSLKWVATTEPYTFAKDIGLALEVAGWTVSLAGGVLTPSPPVGISAAMSVVSNDSVLLQSAFDSIGTPLSVSIDAGTPEDEIRLVVGDSE